MNQLSVSIETFFWNITNRIQFKNLLDIFIIAFLFYKVFLITQQTRAGQVLKGFLLLILTGWVANLFGFKALKWLIDSVVNNGAIVLLILFQPELRNALEQFGRNTKVGHLAADKDEASRIVFEVTQCLIGLARRRVGALIVFEQKSGLKDFIDTGTTLDSKISGPLLTNIFEPNTPLHDGAVIIRDERIVAAGCVLTLSANSSLGRELGTRHRAGLGVTEGTDAIVLIVSEETGIISMAQTGKLTRHMDADSLTKILSTMYQRDKKTFKEILRGLTMKLFGKVKQEDEH